MNKNGFTLVEALCVIVILGLLSGIVIFAFSPSFNEGKKILNKELDNKLIDSCNAYLVDIQKKENDIIINDKNITGYEFVKYLVDNKEVYIAVDNLDQKDYFDNECKNKCLYDKDLKLKVTLDYEIKDGFYVVKKYNIEIDK